jgi:hypothetical protein
VCSTTELHGPAREILSNALRELVSAVVGGIAHELVILARLGADGLAAPHPRVERAEHSTRIGDIDEDLSVAGLLGLSD